MLLQTVFDKIKESSSSSVRSNHAGRQSGTGPANFSDFDPSTLSEQELMAVFQFLKQRNKSNQNGVTSQPNNSNSKNFQNQQQKNKQNHNRVSIIAPKSPSTLKKHRESESDYENPITKSASTGSSNKKSSNDQSLSKKIRHSMPESKSQSESNNQNFGKIKSEFDNWNSQSMTLLQDQDENITKQRKQKYMEDEGIQLINDNQRNMQDYGTILTGSKECNTADSPHLYNEHELLENVSQKMLYKIYQNCYSSNDIQQYSDQAQDHAIHSNQLSDAVRVKQLQQLNIDTDLNPTERIINCGDTNTNYSNVNSPQSQLSPPISLALVNYAIDGVVNDVEENTERSNSKIVQDSETIHVQTQQQFIQSQKSLPLNSDAQSLQIESENVKEDIQISDENFGQESEFFKSPTSKIQSNNTPGSIVKSNIKQATPTSELVNLDQKVVQQSQQSSSSHYANGIIEFQGLKDSKTNIIIENVNQDRSYPPEPLCHAEPDSNVQYESIPRVHSSTPPMVVTPPMATNLDQNSMTQTQNTTPLKTVNQNQHSESAMTDSELNFIPQLSQFSHQQVIPGSNSASHVKVNTNLNTNSGLRIDRLSDLQPTIISELGQSQQSINNSIIQAKLNESNDYKINIIENLNLANQDQNRPDLSNNMNMNVDQDLNSSVGTHITNTSISVLTIQPTGHGSRPNSAPAAPKPRIPILRRLLGQSQTQQRLKAQGGLNNLRTVISPDINDNLNPQSQAPIGSSGISDPNKSDQKIVSDEITRSSTGQQQQSVDLDNDLNQIKVDTPTIVGNDNLNSPGIISNKESPNSPKVDTRRFSVVPTVSQVEKALSQIDGGSLFDISTMMQLDKGPQKLINGRISHNFPAYRPSTADNMFQTNNNSNNCSTVTSSSGPTSGRRRSTAMGIGKLQGDIPRDPILRPGGVEAPAGKVWGWDWVHKKEQSGMKWSILLKTPKTLDNLNTQQQEQLNQSPLLYTESKTGDNDRTNSNFTKTQEQASQIINDAVSKAQITLGLDLNLNNQESIIFSPAHVPTIVGSPLPQRGLASPKITYEVTQLEDDHDHNLVKVEFDNRDERNVPVLLPTLQDPSQQNSSTTKKNKAKRWKARVSHAPPNIVNDSDLNLSNLIMGKQISLTGNTNRSGSLEDIYGAHEFAETSPRREMNSWRKPKRHTYGGQYNQYQSNSNTNLNETYGNATNNYHSRRHTQTSGVYSADSSSPMAGNQMNRKFNGNVRRSFAAGMHLRKSYSQGDSLVSVESPRARRSRYSFGQNLQDISFDEFKNHNDTTDSSDLIQANMGSIVRRAKTLAMESGQSGSNFGMQIGLLFQMQHHYKLLVSPKSCVDSRLDGKVKSVVQKKYVKPVRKGDKKRRVSDGDSKITSSISMEDLFRQLRNTNVSSEKEVSAVPKEVATASDQTYTASGSETSKNTDQLEPSTQLPVDVQSGNHVETNQCHENLASRKLSNTTVTKTKTNNNSKTTVNAGVAESQCHPVTGVPAVRSSSDDIDEINQGRTNWVTEAKILAHESGGVYDCLGHQISNYFHMRNHLSQLYRVLTAKKPIVESWNKLTNSARIIRRRTKSDRYSRNFFVCLMNNKNVAGSALRRLTFNTFGKKQHTLSKHYHNSATKDTGQNLYDRKSSSPRRVSSLDQTVGPSMSNSTRVSVDFMSSLRRGSSGPTKRDSCGSQTSPGRVSLTSGVGPGPSNSQASSQQIYQNLIQNKTQSQRNSTSKTKGSENQDHGKVEKDDKDNIMQTPENLKQSKKILNVEKRGTSRRLSRSPNSSQKTQRQRHNSNYNSSYDPLMRRPLAIDRMRSVLNTSTKHASWMIERQNAKKMQRILDPYQKTGFVSGRSNNIGGTLYELRSSVNQDTPGSKHERLQKTNFRKRKLRGKAWGVQGLFDQQIYNGLDMHQQYCAYNDVAGRSWQDVLKDCHSAEDILNDEDCFPTLRSDSSSSSESGLQSDEDDEEIEEEELDESDNGIQTNQQQQNMSMKTKIQVQNSESPGVIKQDLKGTINFKDSIDNSATLKKVESPTRNITSEAKKINAAAKVSDSEYNADDQNIIERDRHTRTTKIPLILPNILQHTSNSSGSEDENLKIQKKSSLGPQISLQLMPMGNNDKGSRRPSRTNLVNTATDSSNVNVNRKQSACITKYLSLENPYGGPDSDSTNFLGLPEGCLTPRRNSKNVIVSGVGAGLSSSTNTVKEQNKNFLSKMINKLGPA